MAEGVLGKLKTGDVPMVIKKLQAESGLVRHSSFMFAYRRVATEKKTYAKVAPDVTMY